MKNLILKNIFLIVIFAAIFSSPLSAQEVTNDKTPTVWEDIRRTEIVTLGSLPFVTILTTLGFSIGTFIANDFDSAYAPNPFAGNSAGFTQDQQLQIFLTSLGISLGVGVADLTVRLIKRSVDKKRSEQNRQRVIEINPVALDKTATRIPPPKNFVPVQTSGIAMK